MEKNREIIRKCYKEILNRDPDEVGLNHYLNLLEAGTLDEDKLRNIFRNSAEYKIRTEINNHDNKVSSEKIKKYHELIRDCYVELLDRKPSEAEILHYVHLLQNGNINEDRLSDVLKNSAEYNLKGLFVPPETKPKIVAMYRLKNEERWIEKSLKSVSDICEEIVILDDGSTDNTLKICKNFNGVVDIHQQSNLPYDETRDNNVLLKMALKRNPDLILDIDGDEIMQPNAKEILFEELNILHRQFSVFAFQLFYIWDKPNQYRCDGMYGNIWQKRLMRVNDLTDLHYENTTKFPVNVHVEALPNIAAEPIRSRVKILHYGYYDEPLRMRKYNFYNKIDPHSVPFDGYKYMISGDGKLSGPNGMEFKTLPEGMFYDNIK